jgi:methylmalonyl-CoA mutase, C-terminal domain
MKAEPMTTIRVLVGKPGLDGHDRGARVIAAALRDAGMEVVYTGLRATVPAIAAAAVQEDVDVIGLSILSGAHESICRRLQEELLGRNAHIPVVVGGIIPAQDRGKLEALGVAAVFGPESLLADVVDAVRRLANGQPAQPQEGAKASATESAARGIPATRLDHAALCVKDMEASIALIEELLGQKCAHREMVAAQRVSAAFFDFPNGAALELVSPEKSLGGNPGLEKFLEKRGDALHHLALRVRDLDALLRRLDEKGVPLIDKVSRPGARGHKVAFLHPRAFGGTLLELVEAHEDAGPPVAAGSNR